MTYIILLIWNGRKYLPKLFESLAKINYPPDKFKILVLDSASTDGSLEYLERLVQGPLASLRKNLKLIRLASNLGFAAGNNLGMQYALNHQAKYVYLLNQDTKVEPNFLLEAVKKAESEPKIGIVQSLLMHFKEENEIQSLGNQLHYLGYGWSGGNWLDKKSPRVGQEVGKMVYASGAAVLYKASLLKKIGLFDENYFSYHEDSDICLRAKLQGYQVVLAPKSIVYHDYNFSPDKNKLRYFWNEKNRLYLIFKFYALRTLILLLPIIFMMDVGQFIFAAKKGYLWQWLKSRFWFIPNFYKLLKARRQVQSARKMGDKELTKNFACEIKYQPVQNFLLDKIGNPAMKAYWKIVRKFI